MSSLNLKDLKKVEVQEEKADELETKETKSEVEKPKSKAKGAKKASSKKPKKKVTVKLNKASADIKQSDDVVLNINHLEDLKTLTPEVIHQLSHELEQLNSGLTLQQLNQKSKEFTEE